jgi:ubiquinone/menaquinone biosynthesis C-methylase UbiE
MMMPQQSRFWDKIAEKYAKQPVADEASYQKKLLVTREYLRPDMEVVEFGCGTGSTAIAHAPYVKHILAIDVSSRMIEIARRKAEAAKVENVTFRQADIDDIGLPDEGFDVVMGHSILHLVEDRDAVIPKVYRMLKPGGVFVSSTACLGDSQNYLKLVLPIAKLFGKAPSVVEFFTTQELVDSMTDAGFAIDHQWQLRKGQAVFIVAKKPG